MKIRISSSGIHLFNRLSGLNILFDEVIMPSRLWSRAPRQVSIALTNVCDLNCPYCYAPKDLSALDYETLIKWIEELDINGCLGIGFGGGEPTLYPHLIELCSYTAKNSRLAVTLTTHSHRLTNRLLSSLAGNIHFIRVSMDGVGSTYEFFRKRSFDEFKKHLQAAQEIAPIGINYIVNSYTIQDLDAAIILAAKFDVSEFLLLPEQPVFGKNGINEITTKALKLWVSKYDGKVPLTVSVYGSDGLPICDPYKNEPQLHSYVHIDANGILKKTSFERDGIVIDNEGVISALTKLEKY